MNDTTILKYAIKNAFTYIKKAVNDGHYSVIISTKVGLPWRRYYTEMTVEAIDNLIDALKTYGYEAEIIRNNLHINWEVATDE
jgi:hypothetical protein